MALLVSRKDRNASLNQIAAKLNSIGFTTRRRGTFNPKQIQGFMSGLQAQPIEFDFPYQRSRSM